MKNDAHDAPFWDHLAELRDTLVQSLLTVLIAIAICFWFYQDIFSILTQPLQQKTSASLAHQEFRRERISNLSSTSQIYTLPSQITQVIQTSPGTVETKPLRYFIPSQGFMDVEVLVKKNLVLLGPLDGMAITFKVCFWIGVVLSSPFWIYLFLRFTAPAFEPKAWQRVICFISLSILFLIFGGGFAFFVTIPLANQYLELFNSSIGINLWSLAHYLDFTLFLVLANGLAFELSLVLFFLVHFELITPQTLAAKRKPVIVIAFVVGAVLTPPDILTQVMLALPLIGLYEIAILYAYTRQKARLYLGMRT